MVRFNRIKTVITATAAISFLLCANALAVDVAKIGLVDFQKVLETSTAGKAAQAEMRKAGQEMEKELKEKGAAIEEDKQRLEREAMVMSAEMRTEKQREIRIKINDIKQLQNQYMKDFKVLEGKLIKRIKDDVEVVLQQIGKKQGYLLIMDRSAAGVMYSPDALDITDTVIKEYNISFAKSGKPLLAE